MSTGFTERGDLQPATREERERPVILGVTRLIDKPKAMLVRDRADSEAWLPKQHVSRIEHLSFGLDGEILLITIPNWLAIEKGLTATRPDGMGTLF